MNRKLLLACGALFSLASASFAGFYVTYSRVVSGEFDRYDIVAVNTGGSTGTQIKSLEYVYSGSPAFFQVDDTTDPSGGDPDGIGDTVNLLSTSRTRIRVNTRALDNVFAGVSPTNGVAQPNPYELGVTSFSGTITNTGTTQATGAGFQIARLFLPRNANSASFSGNIRGDMGEKVPFVAGQGPPPNIPPVISPVPPVNIVFGQIVSGGTAFSASATVTDVNPADVLSLALGSLPSTVSGVTLIGTTGTSPRTFAVSGIVSYAANGTDVVIPLVASDGTGQTASGSITLHVTPEPGWMSLFAVLMANARKRRTN